MLFNSFEYLVFFLVVCHASWMLVDRPTLRIWMLLVASIYFYTSNNGWQLIILLISTQIDYVCGLRINGSDLPRVRKRYLILSICSNLAILGYFKYSTFFSETLLSTGRFMGLAWDWQPWRVALPVGISFYTFQTMSYTIDVYRGHIPAERSWSRFAFYVTYFPQLIAGPIVRAEEFIPQISRRPWLDVAAVEHSVALIFRGLLKKIVLADGLLSAQADAAFANPAQADIWVAWLGLFAFAFQIYFDFGGYSDVAIGCSRLIGYHLPQNFNLPYTADSFSDFWRRWHMSLSTWLRDYLYIPLGGSRMRTQWGVARNLMLVMVLGGLWHGAAWNFVLWGFIHGLFLLIERRLGLHRDVSHEQIGPVWMFVRRMVVFFGVLAAWIVFRAANLTESFELGRSLFWGATPQVITWGQVAAAAVIAGNWIMQYIARRGEPFLRLVNLPVPVKSMAYALAAAAIVIFNSGGPQSFIYFQF